MVVLLLKVCVPLHVSCAKRAEEQKSRKAESRKEERRKEFLEPLFSKGSLSST